MPTGLYLPTWPPRLLHNCLCTETSDALGGPQNMGRASLETPATLPGGAHAYAGPRGPVRGTETCHGWPNYHQTPKTASLSLRPWGPAPGNVSLGPQPTASPPTPTLPSAPYCWVPTSHWALSIKGTSPSWPHFSFQGLPLHSPGLRRGVCHPPPPSPAQNCQLPPRPPPNKTEHVPVAS